MFKVTKHAEGGRGAFVKLIYLDSDDYAVIVRTPEDGRLQHLYIGPDLSKAEEVFVGEVRKLPPKRGPVPESRAEQA